jgi:Fe-S-cluster-containing dehydrogenase component
MQDKVNPQAISLASSNPDSGNKYLIKLDPQRCISCRACEAHCKVYKRASKSVRLGLLATVGPLKIDGQVSTTSGFRPCFHCNTPWCVAVCPTGAMLKREEDGLVVVRAELCVGCKACIEACPWQAPQWDESARKVVKCDYCRERVEQGFDPACVTGCTAHALSFQRVNLEARRVRSGYAKTIIFYPDKAKSH